MTKSKNNIYTHIVDFAHQGIDGEWKTMMCSMVICSNTTRKNITSTLYTSHDTVAEWLRRSTRNRLTLVAQVRVLSVSNVLFLERIDCHVIFVKVLDYHTIPYTTPRANILKLNAGLSCSF